MTQYKPAQELSQSLVVEHKGQDRVKLVEDSQLVQPLDQLKINLKYRKKEMSFLCIISVHTNRLYTL